MTKKMRTQDFNEVRQFAYVLGAEGERVLIKPINYRIQYQWVITLLIVMESLKKKRKPTNPNSDQKRIQTPFEFARKLLLSVAQGDC